MPKVAAIARAFTDGLAHGGVLPLGNGAATLTTEAGAMRLEVSADHGAFGRSYCTLTVALQ